MPTPDKRMMGHRTIPKVAKYAIVIYEFTRESKYDCHSDSAEIKAKRIARKMMVKLHARLLKDKKYDVDNTHGRTGKFSPWIETLTKIHTDYYAGNSMSMYHLYCNQAVHDIIHEWAEDYNPAESDSKSSKPFFKEIYDELLS